MRIHSDYHVHTRWSGDSKAPMAAQVEAAVRAGLTELCFTDHLDMDFPYHNVPDISFGCFELDIESEYREYLALKERYLDRIRLFFGIELGLMPGLAPKLDAYVEMHPEFDFIIGSTHVVHGMDPYYPNFYEGRTEEAAYREYFETILQNVREFSRFQVCGHLDYIVRYGPNQDREYSYEKYRDLIDPILETLVKNGNGLEINTAGLKKGCRDCNPCRDILKRYRSLGGEIITIGSDAHVPENIAGGFEFARQALLESGFSYYATFEAKKPVMHRL